MFDNNSYWSPDYILIMIVWFIEIPVTRSDSWSIFQPGGCLWNILCQPFRWSLYVAVPVPSLFLGHVTYQIGELYSDKRLDVIRRVVIRRIVPRQPLGILISLLIIPRSLLVHQIFYQICPASPPWQYWVLPISSMWSLIYTPKSGLWYVVIQFGEWFVNDLPLTVNHSCWSPLVWSLSNHYKQLDLTLLAPLIIIQLINSS